MEEGKEDWLKRISGRGRFPGSLVSLKNTTAIVAKYRQLLTAGQVTTQPLLNGGKGPPVRSH